MKAIIQISHNITIEIDDEKEKETLNKAITLGNPRRYCPLCENNGKFLLISNKDKEGNVYINNLCLNCKAKSKLGQYKTGGFFWHEFKIWEGKEKEKDKDKEEEETFNI